MGIYIELSMSSALHIRSLFSRLSTYMNFGDRVIKMIKSQNFHCSFVTKISRILAFVSLSTAAYFKVNII